MALFCTALYSNGAALELWTHQGYSSEDIDRSRLESVIIFGTRGNPILVQRFEPGQRLILRRRTKHRNGIDPATGEPWINTTVILLGWQRQIGKEKIQHISVIFDDEHIENISNYQEDHDWFYPIQEVSIDSKIIGEQ